MLVESLHYNLLSTIQLAHAGYDSLFSEFHVTVFKRDTLKVVFVGDTSQMYLLFQTLLLLFRLHSCMIWTKQPGLTLFSAELPVLFYFVQVSGYLGTLEKSQKNILKISVPEASARPKGATGQPGGSQEGAWRGPAPGCATCPPGLVPHPLVT